MADLRGLQPCAYVLVLHSWWRINVKMRRSRAWVWRDGWLRRQVWVLQESRGPWDVEENNRGQKAVIEGWDVGPDCLENFSIDYFSFGVHLAWHGIVSVPTAHHSFESWEQWETWRRGMLSSICLLHRRKSLNGLMPMPMPISSLDTWYNIMPNFWPLTSQY